MPRKLRAEYPAAICHFIRVERRKSDPARLGLGAQPRRETTLTTREIAQRLRLGTWQSLNNKPYVRSKGKEGPPK